MTFTFRPAVRENVPLLIGIAGGTGSGKSFSALRVATGLAAGKRFAAIDTENGRIRHYADQFNFDVADLTAPFRPDAYVEAIEAADKAGYPVIVVDSASHEYTGVGGLLDWHEEDLNRMAGTDWKRREAMTFAAWVKPKTSHRAMVSRLLQVRAHVILCFRASEKIEIVKDAKGKTVVRPKKSLTGLDGWIPETEKNLPYELTLSLLLVASEPGVPRPVKLQDQHKPFVPLDCPLTEETGRLLGEWARGGKGSAATPGLGSGGPGPAADTGGNGARTPGEVEPPSAAPSPAAEPVITDPQRRRLRAIQQQAGTPDDAMKRIIADVAGVDSSKLIPASRYGVVVEAVAGWTAPEEPAVGSKFKAPAGVTWT